MSWNGCPSCKDCEDREPYSKCTEHCIAYKQWKGEHDRVKAKRQHEIWLDSVTRVKR